MISGDDAAPRPRVLVFTKTATFRHASIPDGVRCVQEILAPDVDVVQTEDATQFSPQNLSQFRAVIFLSTTGDVLDESQQFAFQNYIEGGGGFAGIHAATDTEHQWPWFAHMIGAHFAGHPEIQLATVVVEDKTHPSSASLPDRWPRTDEWYRFNRNPRTVDGVHVLATIDESTYSGGGMDGDHPCIWWRMMKDGRCWYTAGGHTKESFTEPLFRGHLKEGILWAAKLSPPTPNTTDPKSTGK
ncbi:MAG: ThuA domain-containing protein [Phycisphaerales bacterium]|nr:ThuA domain-containing protein [Phycisphaerales bacterium]